MVVHNDMLLEWLKIWDIFFLDKNRKLKINEKFGIFVSKTV